MGNYQFVALILVAIGPMLAVSRSLGAPPSLVLFGLGVSSTVVPGLPKQAIDPELLLDLFLPPLIYASTVRVSWHLLRFSLVPGVAVGVAMVLVTVAAVAVATRVLLPGVGWTTALMLGVVAAVFDTRLFHEAEGRPQVPRAIADALKARELVTRLFVLATFALLLETAETERPSLLGLGEHYGLDISAGVLLGLAIGHAVGLLRRQIGPAPIEIAVSLATPYGAALAATALDVSGVAAITAAALAVSSVRVDRRSGAPISSSEARINAVAFWEEVSVIVSSVLFLLAGRALPQALGALDDRPLPQLAGAALGALAVVLAVQVALSYVSTRFDPIARTLSVSDAPRPRAKAAVVMAWSSTRSVIGIVLALSVPAVLPDGSAFPHRDLILVVAALTILGSVLLQGLTLNRFVARAGLHGAEEQAREEATAREAMSRATASPGQENANAFDAARQALLRLREQDTIGDEILVSMLRETDLSSRVVEANALPGAGPPNP